MKDEEMNTDFSHEDDNKITGFVFQIIDMDGQGYCEEDGLFDSVWEETEEARDAFFNEVRRIEERLKTSNYKVKVEIDYGYEVQLFVELLEPLVVKTSWKKIEKAKEQVFKYFNDEYQLVLMIRMDKGWLLSKEQVSEHIIKKGI